MQHQSCHHNKCNNDITVITNNNYNPNLYNIKLMQKHID